MRSNTMEETARMTKYYRQEYRELIGRTIKSVRGMYPEEMELFMWSGELGAVFTLDNGAMFIPLRDEEGNGPGQIMIDGGRG